MQSKTYDIFIIGGGVNGVGIARDAAGRGLSVGLAEMNDLASATSSASTKLFHGGLRYLEYFELRLVRDSLIERERLLQAMPHISWPMRFVLPLHKDMRFEAQTPASRLLSFFMPWLRGRRPAWMIRFGLFLYDNLGGRKILPATTVLDLQKGASATVLKPHFTRAFEYSDCWVDDARLVVLNAVDACERGADIFTRSKATNAKRVGDMWEITLQTGGAVQTVHAKTIVNAAGPWVEDVVNGVIGQNSSDHVRLVRGSHIVTKKLYKHDKCYFFQGNDGRIIFAIPYEDDFTLIGTTEVEHDLPDTVPECRDAERDYLIDFANQYFETPITVDDVIWCYSGVRPLYDDGAGKAQSATRDYAFALNADGPAILSIFGGKITTYRKLAEHALRMLTPRLPMGDAWTAGVALPGGDFSVDGARDLAQQIMQTHSFLHAKWAARLVRMYGTRAGAVLGNAQTVDDLGKCFGANLTAAEVQYMVAHEFARTADDVLWRRSKLGLRFNADQAERLEKFLQSLQTGID